MTTYDDVAELVDEVIARRGPSLKVGLPLGLGKPDHIANELVDRAVDGEIDRLEIFTALSLATPALGKNELQRRLMEPILDRLFGDVPDLEYVDLRARGELPESVRIHEFYYPPGTLLSSSVAQRHHKNVNFTHVLDEMMRADLDLIGQMVAPSDGGWDLSCNTDLSGELLPALKDRPEDERPMLVAQVNRRLPPLGDSAVIADHTFDAVLDDEQYDHDLFGLPSMPVSDTEYAIGLRVASLLKDGGTVQIGIGGLGDAVSWASILRHEKPQQYRKILGDLVRLPAEKRLVDQWGGTDSFDEGLYGATEMFVEGLLHMALRGVLKRQVDDGSILHGAFYLGSPQFYEKLWDLDDEMRSRISMRSVRYTNLLYGDEERKRRRRVDARFINSAMMVTALGAAVSDGLEDGRVVSGVGGQYEFVAQAHALGDGRSIMMVPATRKSGGEVRSNIVWNYGHCTIPRHLRDIVVTEYGVADLRGKSDEEVVRAMIQICDTRFQDELVERAKSAGKLPQDWSVPSTARNNTPEAISKALNPHRNSGVIERCPFGSSLSERELDLAEALGHLKGLAEKIQGGSLPDLSAGDIVRAFDGSDRWDDHLARMGLAEPNSMRQRLMRRAVIYGLEASQG